MSVLGQMLAEGLRIDSQGFVRIIGEFIGTLTISSTFTGTNGVVTITSLSTNTIDSSKLLGMVSSGQNGFEEWILDVYSKIKNYCYVSLPVGVGAIPVILTTPAFPTMITPSWTQEDLKVAHENNMSDPQGAVMEVIGSGIERDLVTNLTKEWPSTYEVSFIGASTLNTLNF